MLKFFKRSNKDIDEKIVALQGKLEESKKLIRMLRTEMKLLEEQGINADDLDMKILSLDYESKQNALNSEIRHFDELGQMITKLQMMQKLNINRNHIDMIMQAMGDMDMDAIIREADELAVRRNLMKEENEDFELMRTSYMASMATPAVEIGSDFARRVNERKLEKRHAEALQKAQEDSDSASVRTAV